MRTSLDSYLGIHPQALVVEAKRNELLAANLANVDTPNYKARDLDFKAALNAAGGSNPSGSSASVPGSSSYALSLRPSGAAQTSAVANDTLGTGDAAMDAALKYRVPMAPALDGNTVDEQLEQSAFAENSVRYQATLAFLNTKLRLLMNALSSS